MSPHLFTRRVLPLLAVCFVPSLQGQIPLFSTTEVFNYASYQPSLAPGVIAVVFGDNLAVGRCLEPDAPLPEQLCGAQVSVGGRPAPMLFAAASEIRFQIPMELQPGDHPIVVSTPGGRSEPVVVRLKRYAPAIYTSVSTNVTVGRFFRINEPEGEDEFVTPVTPARAGDLIVGLVAGLGPTDPQVPNGQAMAAPTVATPVLVLGCWTVEIISSELDADSVGVYRITFRVPEDIVGGSHPASIRIGGQVGKEVDFPVAGLRTAVICDLADAASFAATGTAVPGSIVSLFAANFGKRESVSTFPQTSVGDVAVLFNRIPAPLFAILPSISQINALVPSELPSSGDIDVVLTGTASRSEPYRLTMTAAAPGIFRITHPRDLSTQFAAAQLARPNIGPWLPLPASFAAAIGLASNCEVNGVDRHSLCAQPAAPGDTLQVYATGLGRATPNGDPNGVSLPTGATAPINGSLFYLTVEKPRATIGGKAAEVTYSGLVLGFAGLYQMNVVIPPDVPRGDQVPIVVTSNQGAADTAMIAIQTDGSADK